MEQNNLRADKEKKLLEIVANCQDQLMEALCSSSVFGNRGTETPAEVREEDYVGESALMSDVRVTATHGDFSLTLGGPVTLTSFRPPTASGLLHYKIRKGSSDDLVDERIPGVWRGDKFVLDGAALVTALQSAVKNR